MIRLPVRPAHQLADCPEQRQWLIEGLWADQAVGIIGGEPKCCKSFLALDLAVAVASGTPCLRRYPVAQAGPVLLFAAEDALHVVRRRLVGLCLVAGIPFANLNLWVITAPSLRLDLPADSRALAATVAQLRPKLLVLDPFVRLHRLDENAANEVAPLLAYLRELQRRYQVAVALVHHARKGAGGVRQGQALRGSSEFHAWGDSNLYLRRVGEQLLTLAIEHRAAPSVTGIHLRLCSAGDALALQLVESAPDPGNLSDPLTRTQRVELVLAQAQQPVALTTLRQLCHMRMAHLCQALADLTGQCRVRKTTTGYQLTSPIPAPGLACADPPSLEPAAFHRQGATTTTPGNGGDRPEPHTGCSLPVLDPGGG